MKKVAETGLALASQLEEFLAQKAEISRFWHYVSVLSCLLLWAEKWEEKDGCGSRGGGQDLVIPAETVMKNKKAACWVEEKGGKKRRVEEEDVAKPVVRGKADGSEAQVASTPVAEDVSTGVVALTVA